jgi:sigma-B regulation protein RsbU (phosphoserine phosphatase)
MSAPDRLVLGTLPDPVHRTLTEFEDAFGLALRLSFVHHEPGTAAEVLYVSEGYDALAAGPEGPDRIIVEPRDGPTLSLEIASAEHGSRAEIGVVLASVVERTLESSQEVRFFTYELSERYEEINLLYSISETLGSILHLADAARVILREVCDVMGAMRGSLWVYGPQDHLLHLTAAVGDGGLDGPLSADDPDAVTSMVFREGRAVIASRTLPRGDGTRGREGDPFLSVPIRYTPPSGESRTVGVMNLVGRKNGGRFSAADQKLLAAIASQVGAALENHRLIQESLSKERMAREMELAHDLQMKLLPNAERFEGAEASARVEPAEQVGGDFYQLFSLSRGRVGVMLGDVSLHGFPSALIMSLTMSAAGIYARESSAPARVLRDLDDALRDELETTEMFLTLFYGVLDPAKRRLVYSNAGHPHAFVVHDDGSFDRLAATDPPVGFTGPDAYSQNEVDFDPRGDLLLLFTDGLSDTLADVTRGDGEERVLRTVVAHRTEPARTIVDALFDITAVANPRITGDDRTALVVRA